MRQNKYEYDAFISHAVEDKIPIANELCAKLEQAGLKIWYSGKELGIGDSIDKTIEKGLNRSRYGIVILSPTYLAKNWTIREFYTLLAKEIEEHKVILPVLYNITLDELKNKDLLMADRFAVNADKGIDFVVERLVREIKKSQSPKAKEAWFSKMWFFLLLSLLTNAGLLLKGAVFSVPKPELIPVAPAGLISAIPDNNMQTAIFGEMHGLFQKLNTCSCKRGEQQNRVGRKKPVTQLTAKPVEGAGSAYGSNDQSGQIHRSSGRNKMTMAVVFQIESAPETPEPIEEEMDEMLNTISLRDQEEDPFVVAKSQENYRYQNKRDCLHTNNLGD
jgi:hypothetical protein